MPSAYSATLFDHYEKLKPHLEALSVMGWEEHRANPYHATVIAALVKNFEFNYSVCDKESEEGFFFLMPFLRGICEDLITLKFMERYDEAFRKEIIHKQMLLLTIESAEAQASFFNKEQIHQARYKHKNGEEEVKAIQAELRKLWHSKGFSEGTLFPSVSAMANDTGMVALYNFLYHATSRVVHFSPNVLLRMGWGTPGGNVTFNTQNFTQYYHEFTVYHGTYLFLKFIKEFKKLLGFNREVLALAKALKKDFKAIERCPEIVTFEEMNVKLSPITSALLSAYLAKHEPNRFPNSL
jgi:hypothetical protein